MKTEDLKQSPFNTTLLGILRGVADHFAIGASDAALFGGSGHAFVINIHEQLCPSGPYCWNGGHFDRLIRNLGIERTDTGFDTAQPWYPHNKDFPPKRLSSGSWTEFGDECHVNFFSYGQIEPASRPETILASLEYAVDLWENPSRHTGRGYGMGPDGYARFIDAVKAGAGDSHGNWWNATVWSECRAMAATYFDEIADDFPEASTLSQDLSRRYGSIAEGLSRVSNKEMDGTEKVALLEAIRDDEQVCTGLVAQCAQTIRSEAAASPEEV